MKHQQGNEPACGPGRNEWWTVLHVDDDPNDTLLLQAASRKAGVDFELVNVEDCDQAMAFLTRKGKSADAEHTRQPASIKRVSD